MEGESRSGSVDELVAAARAAVEDPYASAYSASVIRLRGVVAGLDSEAGRMMVRTGSGDP